MMHHDLLADLARLRQADLLRDAAEYRRARSVIKSAPRGTVRPPAGSVLRSGLRVAAACFARWSVRW